MAVGTGDRTNCYYTDPQNSAWLQHWNNHIEGISTLVLVPTSAHLIHTPLVKFK